MRPSARQRLGARFACRRIIAPSRSPTRPFRAGDHISLADGTHGGNLALDRSFPGDRPLVIRSRNPHRAVLSGQIRVSGQGHWLYELKTTYQAPNSSVAALNVTKGYLTVTRCWIDSRNGIWIGSSAESHHIWIGWNRFTGGNTLEAAINHIKIELPGSFPSTLSGPNNIFIYRNFFFDAKSDYGEDHHIYIGDCKPDGRDIGRMENVVIEYNLIPVGSRRARMIYLKRACDLMFNDIGSRGNVGFRHGFGGRVWGNRLRSPGSDLILNGGRTGTGNNHDVRGNVCEGEIKLFCGAENRSGILYQAADHAVLVGNVGALEVGVLNDSPGNGIALDQGGTVDNVAILAHSGPVRINSRFVAAGTIRQSTGDGGYFVPAAVSLTPLDVGLETAIQ